MMKISVEDKYVPIEEEGKLSCGVRGTSLIYESNISEKFDLRQKGN